MWGPQCECHALRAALVEAFAKPTRNELIIGSGVDAATTNQTFFWMSDRCAFRIDVLDLDRLGFTYAYRAQVLTSPAA